MPTISTTRAEHAVRLSVRIAGWLIVAAALAYPADWAVWRIRVAAGGGMGQVPVSQVTAARLKGDKEGIYWDGITDLDCSRSLFPQDSYSACWYLQRHTEVITTY
jgi:hypothetical protein